MNELQNQVGARIRKFRTNRGWSLEELAHQAGTNPTYLAALERGEKNATILTLNKIVNALELSFIDLFSAGSEKSDAADAKICSALDGLSLQEKEFIYQSILFLKRRSLK